MSSAGTYRLSDSFGNIYISGASPAARAGRPELSEDMAGVGTIPTAAITICAVTTTTMRIHARKNTAAQSHLTQWVTTTVGGLPAKRNQPMSPMQRHPIRPSRPTTCRRGATASKERNA